MKNYFSKTLCSIVLSAIGLTFLGCSPLNKSEDNLHPMAKSAVTQTQIPLTKTFYEPVVRAPTSTTKSNSYLIKDVSLDYQRVMPPKSNHVSCDERLITKFQAREKLYEYFGLDRYLIPNKIDVYSNSGIDARLHWGVGNINDSPLGDKEKQWYQIINSIDFTVSIKY